MRFDITLLGIGNEELEMFFAEDGLLALFSDGANEHDGIIDNNH
jgi:hypothetical protein